MSDPSNPKPPASPAPETGARYKDIGVWVSAAWLIGLGVYVGVKWQAIVNLAPNEVGDALAGAFAPLAFLWLVLGFFQQGAELRNSGKALWLQGEELKNSVEQQRELVAVTRAQLEFESDRISAEKEELRRNAQPILDLTTAGAMMSGSSLRQSFNLSNHGKSCTGVEISFVDGKSSIKLNSLKSGAYQIFDKDFVQGKADRWLVNVSYLDERLNGGKVTFVVDFDGKKFAISMNPYIQPVDL